MRLEIIGYDDMGSTTIWLFVHILCKIKSTYCFFNTTQLFQEKIILPVETLKHGEVKSQDSKGLETTLIK